MRAPDALVPYREQFRRFIVQKRMRTNAVARGVYRLAQRLPYSIDEIDRESFFRLYVPYAMGNDFLPAQLGRVFWDYHVKYVENAFRAYQNEKYGSGHHALSEEEFFAAHGPKPWEVVNEILATIETLTYRVNSPENSDIYSTFQVKLKHTERDGLEIGFDSLSSGERVMMALVASVYKSSSDCFFPDLLLLDEVDASLHPSMMRNMLTVIHDVFLAHGVNVILVSHSPTTIALVSEESLFVMDAIGPGRIRKSTKEEALEVLTQGFATIEQGLRIFDQVAQSEITLITEGHNASIIGRALELYKVKNVDILDGVQMITGSSQLKTIFHFFAKVPHQNKVVVVWDCDSPVGVFAENRTYPYVIPPNPANQLAKKGIENAFPEKMFEGYIATTTKSKGNVIKVFDQSRKADFARHLIANGTLEDFKHLVGLVEEIARIRQDE